MPSLEKTGGIREGFRAGRIRTPSTLTLVYLTRGRSSASFLGSSWLGSLIRPYKMKSSPFLPVGGAMRPWCAVLGGHRAGNTPSVRQISCSGERRRTRSMAAHHETEVVAGPLKNCGGGPSASATRHFFAPAGSAVNFAAEIRTCRQRKIWGLAVIIRLLSFLADLRFPPVIRLSLRGCPGRYYLHNPI